MAAPGDGRPSSPEPRVSKILVVDDKEDNRLLIQHLFDGAEYRVLEAADGVEGLRVALEERPDCILLDLEMPNLGGFTVLEQLEQDPRTREIPVIILTATDDSLGAMERALRGGAVDYIVKPISPLRVAIRVKGALDRRRLLRELQELRTSFTSMLAHDLRGPLTMIKGYAEMLGLQLRAADGETPQRYIRNIHTACEKMIRLIGEMLDLSKLELGKLTIAPQPIDLTATASDVVERLAPWAQQKGLELVVDAAAPAPLTVLGDGARLEQVFMNLLTNALKFTPSPGRIIVRLADLGDEAEAAVVDSGPGISQEELPLLFEQFVQTASGRAKGGSGLGLLICRHLVEAHGGRIWAESEPGHGAHFIFRLPKTSDTASMH